jgi:tetratricopeptide (TPR) repeat protein/CHAT domain-containing protein
MSARVFALSLIAALLTASPVMARPPMPERPSADTRIELLMQAARYEAAVALAAGLADEALAARSIRPETAMAALNRLAEVLRRVGRYAEAEAKAREALRLQESAFGTDDPRLAISLNILADTALTLGRPGEAEALYTRALNLSERRGMSEGRDVAASVAGLSDVYANLGDNDRAEPYARRALVLREMARPADPLGLAESLADLGLIRLNQSDEAEAELHLRRALEIRERHTTPDHIAVANSLAALATLHQRRKQYAEAETLIVRALDICRRTMGAGHLFTAQMLYRLGTLREDQGRPQEAEQHFDEALQVFERTLDERTGYVANTLFRLARKYVAAKRLDEADRAFARALSIHEAIYGESHYLSGLLSEHADVLWSQNRLREATALFERSLTLGEKLPNRDQAVRVPLIGLSSLYYGRGLYDKAEATLKRTIELFARTDPDNLSFLRTFRKQLADIYREQGRLAEAEAALNEVLDQYIRHYGEVHEQTASVVASLAITLGIEERFAESDAAFQRLIAIQRQLYKPDDPRLGKTYASRALALVKLARYTDAEDELKRARAIADSSGDHRLLVNCLGTESSLREELGFYLEAETLMRRVVALEEETYGVGHLETMVPYNNLSGILIELGRHEEAAAVLLKAMEINQAHFEPTHPLYATQMANLASVYQQMGRLGEAMELIRKALAIFETRPHRQATIKQTLASVLVAYGRYGDAVAVQREVAATVEALNGPDHPSLAISLNNLGLGLHEYGYFGEASAVLERGLAILEKRFGPDHVRTSTILSAIASVRNAQNRIAEAEVLHRRVIVIRETGYGPEHPDTALAYSNYAVHLNETGRPAEAEGLLRRARAVFEQKLGPDHRLSSVAVANLATVVDALGRKTDAEALFKEALALREKSYGPSHPDVALSLNNLAAFYLDEKRHQEAVPLLKHALHITEASGGGEDHPQVAMVLFNLGGALVQQERYGEAEPLLERSVAIRERRLGSDHPLTASTLSMLAGLREKRDGFRGVYPITERATAIILGNLRRQSSLLDEAERTNGRMAPGDHAGLFVRHARAAYWLANEQPERSVALRDEVFALAQWAHQSAAAAALSQMSARVAKGEGTLAGFVRQRQDLVWRYQALEKLLLGETAKPASSRDGAAERVLREEAAGIDRTLREIDARLAREFPDYAALANPEPISLAATQALLRENEALYQLLIGKTATLVWVVTRSDVRWTELPVGEQALTDEIEALRCGLDETYWFTDSSEERARSERCWRALQRTPSKSSGLPFDLARAHRLYQTLFGAFSEHIAGRHLLIVPSGPMTTLPPHVLVTEPVKPEAAFSDYGAAEWLGKRHAITVLPSTASLKAARDTPRGASASNPFVSFSNPLLTGKHGTDRTAWDRQSCANIGKPLGVESRAASTGSIGGVYSGAGVDPAQLRRQDPLPETADEACAVGRDLGAQEADIHLGERATEAGLKAMNASGALRGYRILHFATHGLVAGETALFARSRSEPSLLLTPPLTATEEDDGLLTASEVAGLSLNAEATVLSACNTASASGAHNAEALSGLARAFFYAGSRSLLVTHWRVFSDAAVALVTDSFAERRRHPDIALAEALRRAMQASIAGGGPKAHPAWWAPFVVVTAD